MWASAYDRRMAFLNAAPLVRILPLSRRCWMTRRRQWIAPFLDEVSSSCVAYRTQSHLVLLMQGCAICVTMPLPHLQQDLLPQPRWHPLPRSSHLSLVVALRCHLRCHYALTRDVDTVLPVCAALAWLPWSRDHFADEGY